ncbi:MAG: tetratricopeptide repeat protein [Anaerolineae bacterium]|nr:tetratricopeptide repeat protein [Anaerolineae bacterium]
MSNAFKRIVAVLIACVAAMTSVVALWQSNATEMDAQASRDFQRYSLEVIGTGVSSYAQLGFDFNRAYAAWEFFNQLALNAERAGDQQSAARYRSLAERMRAFSPLLQSPYFDQASQTSDLTRYTAERVLIDLARLNELFTAALRVREAWDNKTSAYAIHQTLLSVSLFLLGLALTLTSRLMARLFAVLGVIIALLASAAALGTWLTPVRDLRRVPNAIEAFVEGVSWSVRGEYEKAMEALGRAIAAAPDYTEAYVQRAIATDASGKPEQAIPDYEKARQLGSRSAQLAGALAWAYARTYQYEPALRLYEEATRIDPNEIWAYFDLGLVRLVSGAPFEQVQAAYDQAAALAVRLTAESRASGGAPPSYLWNALDDASIQLDRVVRTLRQGNSDDTVFPLETMRLTPEQAAPIEALSHRLKSLAVSLEYYGTPPAAAPTARFGTLQVTDSEGVERQSFSADTATVWLEMTFSGARDGSDLVIKFFRNGVEESSLRIFKSWEHGIQGSARIEIAASEGSNVAFEVGDYVVELYLDGQFMASGRFRVE